MRVIAFILCGLIVPAAASASLGPAYPGPILTGPTGREVQVSAPEAAFAGHRPIGTVMTIHGGAWEGTGPGAIVKENNTVKLATFSGWQAVNVDYRPDGQSIADVIRIYDWAKRRYADGRPMCVFGDSAGAHLAMLVAAARSSMRCVVGMGTPTDLPALATNDPWLYNDVVVPIFGVKQLAALSPVTYAKRICARVLLGAVANDQQVPPAQMHRYLAADPDSAGMVLQPGPVPFTHGGASWPDYARFVGRLGGLLRGIANHSLKPSRGCRASRLPAIHPR